ncbi:DUF4198 domain-containing protein [Parapedobacter lycopersici]|uniref:DUF4198 domain-containing protein n=1 Tax=Parapedobacter lycopersici TaxID=1864939 RepID=UPI00214D6CEB|nr:DUF4198 domain-containing protein [Parapedobacter lycopersici]
MKTIYVMLIWAGSLCTALQVQAHALWIETSSTGQRGAAHEVRIYYGEPAAATPDKTTAWWSDVGTFVLQLHLPDGSSRTLTATPEADYYIATFTPETGGAYTLSIAKPVAETFEGHKYQFNGTAVVTVGNTLDVAEGVMADFRVFTDPSGEPQVNLPVDVHARLDGKPVEELEVTVFSPNGWSKTFQTDGNGSFSFVPDRKGTYLVEALHSAEVTGDGFEHLHRISTYHMFID